MTSSPPRHVRVFIDETSDQHNQFGLVAILIEPEQETQLGVAWQQLRTRIREVLRESYPKWQAYEAKRPDTLPEIHATDMYQSAGYFRNTTHPDPLFWQQHSTWLSEAFALQGQFDLPIIGLLGEATRDISEGSFTDALLKAWSATPTHQYILKKLEKLTWLEARAYTWALPTMLFHLEAELTHRNLVADIICDEGNEERGFRLSELLKTFQESGVFQRIRKVLFRSSETEVGLQIADIHAYAMIRTQGLQKGFVTRKITDQWLEQMVNDFTDKQCQLVASKPLDTRQRGLARMLSIEYIIRHSGLPTEVIQSALEVYQKVLDDIAPA
jgi:hypothetical protein